MKTVKDCFAVVVNVLNIARVDSVSYLGVEMVILIILCLPTPTLTLLSREDIMSNILSKPWQLIVVTLEIHKVRSYDILDNTNPSIVFYC